MHEIAELFYLVVLYYLSAQVHVGCLYYTNQREAFILMSYGLDFQDPTKGHSNSTLTDPLVKILIPNLLLLAFASLLPLLVSYSSYLEAHWTK